LIFLDNVDQISLRPDDIENYKKILDEIVDILNDTDSTLGVYIVVMRHDTQRELPITRPIVPKIYAVNTPTLHEIYTKRKEFLLGKLDGGNKDVIKSYIDMYSRIIGSSFRKSKDYYKILPINESLTAIKDFCGIDMRRAITLMRLYQEYCFKNINIKDYLNECISKENLQGSLSETLQYGYYRFFEALMINRGYCARIYNYTNNNGSLKITNQREISIEDQFVPNLFSFPCVNNDIETHYSVFLKIRILQFLNNLEPHDGATVKEINMALSELFDYRKQVINIACRELQEWKCIVPQGNTAIFQENSIDIPNLAVNTTMKITQKGRIVLKTFPEKINYLSVCLEDMPIPLNHLTKMISGNRFCTFPINNYHFEENNVYPFILENIMYSSPIIIGILKKIEEHEFAKYKKEQISIKHKKRINYSQFFKEDDFKVIENLLEDAYLAYEKIINSYMLIDDNRHRYYCNLPNEYRGSDV
jgi:hypothetical protein